MIAAGTVAADVVAIVGSAFVTGTLYHLVFYADAGVFHHFFQTGFLIAFLFVLPNLIAGEYEHTSSHTWQDSIKRIFPRWNIAFVAALALGFITKMTGIFSRSSFALFYLVGFLTLVGFRTIILSLVRAHGAANSVSVRRVFLVGYEEEIDAFRARHENDEEGFRIIGATALRRGNAERFEPEDVALAVSTARFLSPDDVFILLPWSDEDEIRRCIDGFLTVPASIHLAGQPVLDRFDGVSIGRLGTAASLNLVRRPLSIIDVMLKRAFDLGAASLALVALAPLFALVAVLIKLDSPGPVFYLQRRYGFNQTPFRIFKFRSMTTFHDGGVFEQARAGDARITRVGRFLRRWNIDELPQLINVLLGDMSLVGPRPHALAHDQSFENRIAFYARRHNVMPGITGWAQVNGLRGETSTDESMRRRVECDLYYIDNWSLFLDLKIILLTVFSPKAYRNAQ